MTIKAGVWINDHKAIVIFATEAGGHREWWVMSDPDIPPWVADRAQVKNHHLANDSITEDQRHSKEIIFLDRCYDEVIAYLHDADAIHILGPGDAKREFAERIRETKLTGHIAYVGTTDHMTDREIVCHLRRRLAMGSSPESRFEPELRKSNHLELS